VYVFDTIKFGEQWIFNGGVRVDHYNTSYNAITVQAVTTPQTIPVGTLVGSNLETSDNLINGKLSALYKPTKDSSVYALVASSKAPPGGANFALSTAASSAANRTSIRSNHQLRSGHQVGPAGPEAVAGRRAPTEVKTSGTGPGRRQVLPDRQEARARYRAGRDRRDLPKWLVSAGYVHQSTSVESGKIVTAGGDNQLTYTPKQSFTAWSSYTLPFGLQIGGGARFSDKLARGTDGAVGTPAYADSYWVFDAMASYPINKHIDLRLNVYNLGDKNYVQAINKSGYRYTPGAPRSGSLTANFKF
jgi:catecholate siderophore receptor